MNASQNKLKVYNSYSRSLEDFIPLAAPHVGMYVCGPTMSGESHLGHARPYITFDVVYRYLQCLGYNVRYVRNITDVGHFEGEAANMHGDKILKQALLESLEPMELSQRYLRCFHEAMGLFNCLPPTIEPAAAGHIVEQIEMIKKIIGTGYAYESNGSIYFSVRKYAQKYNYGKLSGRVVDELLQHTRTLEGQEEKRDAADFALWKKAPEKHIMRWASPWGEGFPGWHLECSAMSAKYLGEQFDIHGGGMDLLFPHHESEIAQSMVCHGGKLCAKYWLHNNMITINGQKMGKRYDNHIALSAMFTGEHKVLAQAYSPMNIRFFILQTHYRSTLDFSNEALQASRRGLQRLLAAYDVLNSFPNTNEIPQGIHGEKIDTAVRDNLGVLDGCMKNDFNTAKVIATLFNIVPIINAIHQKEVPAASLSTDTLKLLTNTFTFYIRDILGLFVDASKKIPTNHKMDKRLVELILELRDDFKRTKQYEKSDAIRRQLTDLGVDIKDNKDGTTSFAMQASKQQF